MGPRLIFGDRQRDLCISSRNIDSYMHEIEKRIIDIPDDLKKLFDLLYLENLYLAYAVGGYELLEEIANRKY